MSDREVIALAALAWLGAAIGWRTGAGPPATMGALAVLGALLVRRPPLLLVAVVLLTSGRAAADSRGLVAPAPGPVHAWATLITDPAMTSGGGAQVEVRLGGRHLLASASGAAGTTLSRLAAGEQALVDGTLGRAPPGADWLARRHIVGQLHVLAIDHTAPGSVVVQAANAVRDLLEQSARALPEGQRGLYLGFVLGDDRNQPPAVVDDFRGSGLSHLLVVSGENVAFVLVLVGPLLGRLPLRGRWTATLGAIAFFALITRLEPSVLRASVMAALAATAVMLGREASGIRLLALAVAALVVADPFLIGVVGFQLSVAASAAILVLAAPIAARVPGPRVVAEAVGVSAAAQLGVAPLLVATFGGAPVGSLLANVLAAPAAGPVMVWGVFAGVVGGAAGGAVAVALHAPTRLLIAWIAAIAHAIARLPLGEVHGGELVLLAVAGGMAVASHRRVLPGLRVSAVAVTAIALVAPAVAVHTNAPTHVALTGAELWQSGGHRALVLARRARSADVLAGLRSNGISALDVVVATQAAARSVAEDVVTAVPVGGVVGPGDLTARAVVTVGNLQLDVTPAGSELAVVVTAPGRDPPV